jgi:hypothetical protein
LPNEQTNTKKQEGRRKLLSQSKLAILELNEFNQAATSGEGEQKRPAGTRQGARGNGHARGRGSVATVLVRGGARAEKRGKWDPPSPRGRRLGLDQPPLATPLRRAPSAGSHGGPARAGLSPAKNPKTPLAGPVRGRRTKREHESQRGGGGH